jgi:hypothetical protein
MRSTSAIVRLTLLDGYLLRVVNLRKTIESTRVIEWDDDCDAVGELCARHLRSG